MIALFAYALPIAPTTASATTQPATATLGGVASTARCGRAHQSATTMAPAKRASAYAVPAGRARTAPFARAPTIARDMEYATTSNASAARATLVSIAAPSHAR